MKLNEYASRFENPEADLRCGEDRGKGETSEESKMVLAGTILAVTDRYCRIDINGGKYEIDARDVIEIEELPVQKGRDNEDSGEKVPRTVLITLDRTAVLCQLVPVQAAMQAAVGTWMWVVAPAREEGATEQGVM